MHGFIKSSGGSRQSARAHFRHGQRMAAVRALTAAHLYLDSPWSLQKAAESCGSNVAYVRAAIALVRSENQTLINTVIRGFVPILTAAKQVQQLGQLIAAYRSATVPDRIAFAKVVGPTTLFDTMLAPAVERETVAF